MKLATHSARRAPWLLAASLLLTLSGCGGGSSNATPEASGARALSVIATTDCAPGSNQLCVYGYTTGSPDANIEILVNGSVLSGASSLDVPHGTSAVLIGQPFTVPTPTKDSTVSIVYLNGDGTNTLNIQGVRYNGVNFAPTLADYTDTVTNTVTPGQAALTDNGRLDFPFPVAALSGNAVFVDAFGGSDSSPNGSPAQPWKTLAHMSTNAGGKNVYLRCRRTWYESLTADPSTGFPTGPGSKLTSYGAEPDGGACSPNDRPVISGAKDYSDVSGGELWIRNASNGTWSHSLASTDSSTQRLYVNGVPIRMAEWPTPPSGGSSNFALAASGSGCNISTSTCTIMVSSADATTLENQIGSATLAPLQNQQIFIRTSAYSVRSTTVSQVQGNALIVDSGILEAGDAIAPCTGYVLQNAPWMLSTDTSAFVAAAGQLTVGPGAPSPSGAIVGISSRAQPVSITNVSGLTISNLRVTGAAGAGIYLGSGGSTANNGPVTVNNVDSSGNAGAGISLFVQQPSTQQYAILGNTFTSNWDTAIDSRYAAGSDIEKNIIGSTGMDTPTPTRAGIVGGPSAKIENNQISDTPYIAIRIIPLDASTVSGNILQDYCARLTDCGAIYTANEPDSGQSPPAPAPGTGAMISGNIIGQQTANTHGAPGPGAAVVAGIYLDDFTGSTVVNGNMLYGMTNGINIHDSSYNTISNNKIWLTTNCALCAGMSVGGTVDYMVGNQFSGNELVPVTAMMWKGAGYAPTFSSSYAFWFDDIESAGTTLNESPCASPIANRGGCYANTFTNNKTWRLNGLSAGKYGALYLTTCGTSGLTPPCDVDPSEWQHYTTGSSFPDTSVAPSVTNSLYSYTSQSPLIDLPDSNTGSFDVGAWTSTTGVVQLAPSGPAGIDMTVSGYSDTYYPPSLTYMNNQMYVVDYLATVTELIQPPADDAVMMDPYPRVYGDNNSIASSIGSDSLLSAWLGSTINYEGFFVTSIPSGDTYSGLLGLKMRTAGMVTITNVKLSLIDANSFTSVPVSNWARVAYSLNGGAVLCKTLFQVDSCNMVPVDNPQASPAPSFSLTANTAMLYLMSP